MSHAPEPTPSSARKNPTITIPHKKLVDRIVFGILLPLILLAIVVSHFTLLPFDQSIVVSGVTMAALWFGWRKLRGKR